ncbi:MAG: T9SS type A sorting domain-containing protein [Ignavibacteria bacterium]|nr:T9SS type A sorting domain-containing protein [Ignavibacteria bacterium]NNL21184.1 T9SS type A sorting domain-containing protein [Ignavibacteriaceae bacterium]
MKQNLFITALLVFFFSLQIINAQGIIKDDFLVNDDTVTVDHHNPDVTMNNSGNLIIVWNDERSGWDRWDIFFQRYDSNGNPIGANVLVNDDVSIYWVQKDPAIAMNDAGNFVIAWEDDRVGYDVIYYQLFDSNGNPIGTNQKANDFAAVANDPAVAIDDAGNFVIAWRDYRNAGDRDIYFQLFDSNGNKIGVNVKANDDVGSAHQEIPSIAMNGSGNFIIAWEDFRDGNVLHVYMQRYNSNGSPLGSNVRVDDDPSNSGGTSIAIDAVGNFVVVWVDQRSGYNIYFQMYDNGGNAIGSNVKVSDDIGNITHSFPNVAMIANGDFVVTWRSYTTLIPDDVEGQRYFANGTPNGGNYLVVADGPNHIESLPCVAANSTQMAFAWTDNRRTLGRFDTYGKLVTWNWNGVTNVEIIDDNAPEEFSLSQNYPNPFNPSTKISFQIAEGGFTSLKVYDVLGNEVATLVNGEITVGEYEVDFYGEGLTSGIYFYQIKAESFIQTKKMILLK